MRDILLQISGIVAIAAALIHRVLTETKIFPRMSIQPDGLRTLSRFVWQIPTVAWIAGSQGHLRTVFRALGPILRPMMRTALKLQRRAEGRGRYADPWTLIAKKYGPGALANAGS